MALRLGLLAALCLAGPAHPGSAPPGPVAPPPPPPPPPETFFLLAGPGDPLVDEQQRYLVWEPS